MNRLNALRALIHDAVNATVDLVEQTHASTAKKQFDLWGSVPGLGDGTRVVSALHDGIAKTVYSSIRLVNRGVDALGALAMSAAEQGGLDAAVLQRAELAMDPGVAHELSFWADSAQSALNAWIGDFLARRENALAIPMGFFIEGKPVELTREALSAALPNAGPKLCVFVHGLGCTEASWSFRAADTWGDSGTNYSTLLARDLGYTCIFVRYNTGLHISQNARELSTQLELLCAAYPGALEEIALVGHSMGGLVARGAAHYGKALHAAWLKQLTHVLCIGSPNHGAPLEKATHLLAHLLSRFDTPGTQVPAKLLNTRSSGIKDLRFGYVLDEHWTDKDPDAYLRDDRCDVPMVPSATYGFIAASFLHDPADPLGHLLGDLLVRIPSASGRHEWEDARHVRFDIGEVVHGVHHLAMLNHPAVYEQVRRFLASRVLEAQGEEILEPVASLVADCSTPGDAT